MLVVVTPVGTVENPGLRLWLNCRPSQNGPYLPDIVNVPRWDPVEGRTWDHLKKDPPGHAHSPKVLPPAPALQTRISLKGGPASVIETVLAEFERTTDLPVLGEYDPCYQSTFGRSSPARRTLPAGAITRLPAREAVEVLARVFDLTWEYRAGWIWLRSPRTPLARAGQLDLSPPQTGSNPPPRR